MKTKILIVDNDVQTVKTLKTYFLFHGFTVYTAVSGKEALHIVQKEKFHVVLIDINLPDMSELELLDEIKAKDFLTQVLMITDFSTLEKTLHSIKRGAVDYIVKPIDNLYVVLKLVNESINRMNRWRKNFSKSLIPA